jgi:hypothetical protein
MAVAVTLLLEYDQWYNQEVCGKSVQRSPTRGTVRMN